MLLSFLVMDRWRSFGKSLPLRATGKGALVKACVLYVSYMFQMHVFFFGLFFWDFPNSTKLHWVVTSQLGSNLFQVSCRSSHLYCELVVRLEWKCFEIEGGVVTNRFLSTSSSKSAPATVGWRFSLQRQTYVAPLCWCRRMLFINPLMANRRWTKPLFSDSALL